MDWLSSGSKVPLAQTTSDMFRITYDLVPDIAAGSIGTFRDPCFQLSTVTSSCLPSRPSSTTFDHISASRKVRFIYQPKRGIYNWKGTIVKGLESDLLVSAFYFDPATGRRFEQGAVSTPSGEYQPPRLPSAQEWVLVLENYETKCAQPAMIQPMKRTLTLRAALLVSSKLKIGCS